MAIVHIPRHMRDATGGAATVEVPGGQLARVVEEDVPGVVLGQDRAIGTNLILEVVARLEPQAVVLLGYGVKRHTGIDVESIVDALEYIVAHRCHDEGRPTLGEEYVVAYAPLDVPGGVEPRAAALRRSTAIVAGEVCGSLVAFASQAEVAGAGHC